MTGRHAAALCLVLSVLLAGCSGVPFLGSSCGPGGTELGSIDGNASDITVEGELTEVRDAALVVDDGTGTAEVLVLEGNATERFETGDCVVVEGTGSQTPESEQDVVLVAANVSAA
jgi:aspartyl/asparaginyl-tRNA synthetase